MRRSGKGSGGGIGMNKNVRVGVRTGRGGKAQSPAAVNQRLGGKVGDHVTEKAGSTGYRGEMLERGPGYNTAPGFGNAVALNVGGGGPGKGYNVIGKAGQQGTHGPVNPGQPMPRGEIFPGFGGKGRS
jgi:hypothetical protein